MLTFTDVAGGYRLKYPADWKLADHTAKNALIRADFHGDRYAGFQVRIYDQAEQDFTKFVDRYLAEFTDGMRKQWGGSVSGLSREHVTIGRYPGCCISLTFARKDGPAWFFKQFLWPRGGKAHVLQCGTRIEHRLRDEPVLDAVAETFEFLPAVSP